MLAALAVTATAASAAEWRSEQPVAAGIGVPTTLGEIGDVEFWAPNRGMLITAGNEGVPAGPLRLRRQRLVPLLDRLRRPRRADRLGRAGRLLDDLRPAGRPGNRRKAAAPHISLCHFVNGGRWSPPTRSRSGVAGSYLPMDARRLRRARATAGSPANGCPATTNVGAFHLHWDGAALTAVPSLTEPQPEIEDPGRSVASLAFHDGGLYESVLRCPKTAKWWTKKRKPNQPPAPGSTPSASPFKLLFPARRSNSASADQPARLEAAPPHRRRRRTAVGGRRRRCGGQSHVTVLRLGRSDRFEQVPLEDPDEAVLAPAIGSAAVAAEPGSGAPGSRSAAKARSFPAR